MASASPAFSFAGYVRSLSEGESATKSVRLGLDRCVAQSEITKTLATLRNGVNVMVSKERTRDGSNFRVESGAYLSDDKQAIVCCATITRVGATPEDDDI